MQQNPAFDLGQILNVFSKISPEQWHELGMLAQSAAASAPVPNQSPEIESSHGAQTDPSPAHAAGDLRHDAPASISNQCRKATNCPPSMQETAAPAQPHTQPSPSESAPPRAMRQRTRRAVALADQAENPDTEIASAVHGASDGRLFSNADDKADQNISPTCELDCQNSVPVPVAPAVDEIIAGLSLDALDLLCHKMAKAPLPARRCPFVPLVGAVNSSAAAGALIAYDPDEIGTGGEAGFTDGLVLALDKKYLSQLLQNDQSSGLPYSAWTAPFILFALSQKAKALGAAPVCSINKMTASRQMKCAIHPDDDSVRIRLVSTKDMRQILSRSSDPAAIALCERLGGDPIRDKAVCASVLRRAIRIFPKDPVLSWAGPEPAADPCGFFGDAATFAKNCLQTTAEAHAILEKYKSDTLLCPLFEIAAAAELRCLIPAGPEGARVAISAMNGARPIPAPALLSVCSVFDGQPDLLRQVYGGIKTNPAIAPQIKLAVLESLLNC